MGSSSNLTINPAQIVEDLQAHIALLDAHLLEVPPSATDRWGQRIEQGWLERFHGLLDGLLDRPIKGIDTQATIRAHYDDKLDQLGNPLPGMRLAVLRTETVAAIRAVATCQQAGAAWPLVREDAERLITFLQWVEWWGGEE